MSLKEELATLRNQQHAEIRHLHRTYLATRRQARRDLSPTRFLRKHLGASLGVAAVAGLLLAPRPSPRADRDKNQAIKRRDTVSSQLARLLKHAMDQIERIIAPRGGHGSSANASTSAAGAPSKAGGLLQTFVMIALGKLDLTRLLTELARMATSLVMRKRTHEGNGHAPEVSVADAGTVKPDQFQDFE